MEIAVASEPPPGSSPSISITSSLRSSKASSLFDNGVGSALSLDNSIQAQPLGLSLKKSSMTHSNSNVSAKGKSPTNKHRKSSYSKECTVCNKVLKSFLLFTLALQNDSFIFLIIP